jgi:hypothetical protein
MITKSYLKLIGIIITASSIILPTSPTSARESEVPRRSLPSIQKSENPTKWTKKNPTKWTKVEFKMGPSTKYWDKVAKCETNSDWQDGGNWGGGLGIALSTWKGYGGLEFALEPGKATKIEQIVVANRISVFGYQTKDTYITLEDKLANKPFYRPPVSFYGWGCIKNNKYLKPPKSTTYSVSLPLGKQYYCPEYEPIFEKYALPAKVFSYIAWRESRCNPGAINAIWKNGKLVWTLNKNGSYDSGLLQINSSWFKTLRVQLGHTPEDLMNPSVNALFASWLLHFSSGRLSNWSLKALPA